MQNPEYDRIANEYARDAELRDDRAAVLVPTARYYCGDLTGKTVLDLACGSGFFTRLLQQWGAKEVTGVDISGEEIALARDQEVVQPLGIQYEVGNVSESLALGEFDLAFAGFLFHYAATTSELVQMAKTVASSLKPGGKLIAFSENPEKPVHAGVQYGVQVEALGPIADGVKIRRTHYENGKALFSFEHHHYEKATYERALQQAGLQDIRWPPFTLSEQAAVNADYWQSYITDFSIRPLLAVKP